MRYCISVMVRLPLVKLVLFHCYLMIITFDASDLLMMCHSDTMVIVI